MVGAWCGDFVPEAAARSPRGWEEGVILSGAKDLCSYSQVVEQSETAEILRSAQDDRWLIFP